MFGPEYTKIQTVWMRDERNVIIPGEYSLPELAYLAANEWTWAEKVNGTNIRLHWNGSRVTLGGRTDDAMVPATLVASLGPVCDPDLWRSIFPDADDVTVYGEGYGGKIGPGHTYRPDQALTVFDVLVGRWWLSAENVADVAGKLGLDTVPEVGVFTLLEAWEKVKSGDLVSRWPEARIEGLVGRPAVDLFTRKGDRLIVKMKLEDWADYQRRSKAATA